MEIEIQIRFQLTTCTRDIQQRVREYLQSTTFLRDTTNVLQSGSHSPEQINHYIYFKAHDTKLDWNKHLIRMYVYGVYKTPDPLPIPHGWKEIQKEISEIFAHKAFSGFYGKFDEKLWVKHKVTLDFPKATLKNITLLPKLRIKIPKQYRKVCPLGSKCFSKLLIPPQHENIFTTTWKKLFARN